MCVHRQQPVAARHIELAVEHDAGAVTRSHGLRLAHVVEHLGHGGGLTAGHHLDRLPDLNVAGGDAAPEHAAALAGVGRVAEFFNPLQRESKRQAGLRGGDRQSLQDFQQRGAVVAAPMGLLAGVYHIPSLQRRNGRDRRDRDVRLAGKLPQRSADVHERECAVGHGVEFVDRKHHGGHAQQLEQQRMAAGLRQQFQTRGLPVQLGRVHQHHGGVGGRGGGHHVAGVLLVAGRVADDELAGFGVEVAVSHVDGDALLALGRQTVGQQRQIGHALALHARQVVLQHRLAVHQQATDQRALAVVDRAAGDEFQRGAGVLCEGFDRLSPNGRSGVHEEISE